MRSDTGVSATPGGIATAKCAAMRIFHNSVWNGSKTAPSRMRRRGPFRICSTHGQASPGGPRAVAAKPDLFVVDPLASFLPGRCESDAASLPRKQRAEVGSATRGSGAMLGFVDTNVELSRAGCAGCSARRLGAPECPRGSATSGIPRPPPSPPCPLSTPGRSKRTARRSSGFSATARDRPKPSLSRRSPSTGRTTRSARARARSTPRSRCRRKDGGDGRGGVEIGPRSANTSHRACPGGFPLSRTHRHKAGGSFGRSG